MKKKIKIVIKIIKKYLPDIIILIGIWMVSYNLSITRSDNMFGYRSYIRTSDEWKIFGIILIAIGIDIAIRRYIAYKKK